MNKIVFPNQIRVKGIDFAVYEYKSEECGLPKIHREAVPVKNRENTKKIATLLNELALEHQFSIQWDWEQILYGVWEIRGNEVRTHAHLKGRGADLVHISIPIDGGDPICTFRYTVGLRTYYSQFNHDF